MFLKIKLILWRVTGVIYFTRREIFFFLFFFLAHLIINPVILISCGPLDHKIKKYFLGEM